MSGLRGRWVVVLTPLSVLGSHVIDRSSFSGHRAVRVLLGNLAEWALCYPSVLQDLDDTVPFWVDQQHGPVGCVLPGFAKKLLLIAVNGAMVLGLRAYRFSGSSAWNAVNSHLLQVLLVKLSESKNLAVTHRLKQDTFLLQPSIAQRLNSSVEAASCK